MIEFRIAMLPRGQGRPRATVRGKHAGLYEAKEDVQHKQTIASLAAPHCPRSPLDGALSLRVLAIMPRPATLCGRSKRTGLPLQDPGRRWHTSKPDGDNLIKAVADALRNFWRDDAQIAHMECQKVVAALDEQPGYLIAIDVLDATPVMPDVELDETLRLADAFGSDRKAAKTAREVV